MNPNHFQIRCENVHHYLPRVGMKTLIQRNICRYMKTGRFIPTRAIIDTCHRVDQLIESAYEKMKKISKNETMVIETETTSGITYFSKFDLDCAMAELASFGMRKDRTIYRIPRESWSRGRGNYNSPSGLTSRDSNERYLERNPAGRGDQYRRQNPSGRGRFYQENWGRGRYNQGPVGEGRQGRGYKRHYQGDDRRDYHQHENMEGGPPRYDRPNDRPYGQNSRQQSTYGTRGGESARFGHGGGGRRHFYSNRNGRGTGRGGKTT